MSSHYIRLAYLYLQTANEHDPKASNILNILAQLRNRIWECALTSPTPLHYCEPLNTAADREAFKNTEVHCFQELAKPLLYTATPDEDSPQFLSEVKLYEYNQLKYVNKQLYWETTDLELQYNALLIRRTSPMQKPRMEQLVELLFVLSREKR